MRRCPKCGEDNAADRGRCSNCGVPLPEHGEAQPNANTIDLSDAVVNRSPINASQVHAPAFVGGIHIDLGKSDAPVEYCSICGKRMQPADCRCPKCERFVCEEHFVSEHSMCERCDQVRERDMKAEPPAQSSLQPSQDTLIPSHLGNEAPRFEQGMTPRALGWGGDGAAYPARFVVNPLDGAEMVWVPPGRFRMGSTEEEIDLVWYEAGWGANTKAFAACERPVREVEVAAGFWLYRHQVTNGQYARYLAATGSATNEWWDEYRTHERLPVIAVNWHAAEAYARWADAELPTEASWEWAARGPERRVFPWGDLWNRDLCCCAEYWAQTAFDTSNSHLAWSQSIRASGHEQGDGLSEVRLAVAHLRPVGSFPGGTSWCGAMDMVGNALEWCADEWVTNWLGLAPTQMGERRPLRGGAWLSEAYQCRCAYRSPGAPSARGPGIAVGLRLAVR